MGKVLGKPVNPLYLKSSMARVKRSVILREREKARKRERERVTWTKRFLILAKMIFLHHLLFSSNLHFKLILKDSKNFKNHFISLSVFYLFKM